MAFLFNVPRITKKGGKSTATIAKNNDYLLCYTLNTDIIFSQEEKTDLGKFKYEDEFVAERGKYALTQTLDYNSLQYSEGMDYEIEFKGRKFVPGLSFIDNVYSNDNGKKELDTIFKNGSQLFKNPKPTKLISTLVKMVCGNKKGVVLDFFAGSGTTGHSVLDLNRELNLDLTYILCTINEQTPTTPNGIACDVTSKRLKRIMSGQCYDGDTDFDWIKKNKPYGDSLDVYDIDMVADNATEQGRTPFDVIDETLYGKVRFSTMREKIEWVCQNFQRTEKYIEE